jgi:hypothetical protein
MLRSAQCEKAVTISELMGRSRRGSGVPVGSKTPIDFGIPVPGSLDLRVSGSPCFCLLTALHPVFNGLQAEKVERGKPLGGTDHYLLDGHVDSTRGARFGPNFVTILPTGVCVCSI